MEKKQHQEGKKQTREGGEKMAFKRGKSDNKNLSEIREGKIGNSEGRKMKFKRGKAEIHGDIFLIRK